MEPNISYKNPYPGIRSFNIEESALFFGRDKQISELLEIVRHSRFAAISGASGSGKSSLIKAGLIPRITENKSDWEYLLLRPGNAPLENFVSEIHKLLIKNNYDRKVVGNKRSLLKEVSEQADGLVNYLNTVNFNKKLLVYIDQFEEIFRYLGDEQKPEAIQSTNAFINMLLHSVRRNHQAQVHVILSLRSDFLGQCSQFIGLSEAINSGHFLIPKMTDAQKLEAVLEPAKRAGADISPQLTARIQEDIQKTDNLLVLQHAMMRTWDNWLLNSDAVTAIDVKHYEAVGTVSNALSVHAEMIYNSLPDEKSKKITEKIFKALTELGEDKKGIRRPASLKEISKITGYPEPDILDVSEKFREEGNCFIMPDANVTLSSNSILDIAHESIMKVWIRLSQWVLEETKAAQTYLRLSKSAELYQEGKAGLLVDPDLQLAVQWLEENQPNSFWAERYDPNFERVMLYIDYSRKEHNKYLLLKEENQKKRLKKTRAVAIFLGTASLISLFFLIIAFSLKIKAEASEKKALESEQEALTKGLYAEQQKRQAVSNELIARQQRRIAEQHRLLAEEQKEIAVEQRAIATREKNRAIHAMQLVSEEKKKVESLLVTAENLRALAEKREKEAIAEQKRAIEAEKIAVAARKLSSSKTLALQAVKIYQENQKFDRIEPQQYQLPFQLALYAYHFSGQDSVKLFDTDIFNALSLTAESDVLIRSPHGHTASVRKAVFSPNGNEFASVSSDNTLRIFDTRGNPKYHFNLSGAAHNIRNPAYPLCLAYTPDGKKIVIGDDKGNISMWEANAPHKPPITIRAHNGAVRDILAISQNDIISVGNDGKILLFDNFQSNVGKHTIKTMNGAFTHISVDETGQNIAVAGERGKILIFSASRPDKPEEISLFESSIQSLTWGKDKELFAGTEEGKIFIIKDKTVAHDFFAHSSAINSIIYDKHSNHIYTCSYDKTIKIWQYGNYDYATIIDRDRSWVLSLDYLPETKQLLAAYENRSLEIININISDLIEAVKSNVQNEMTAQSWARFIGEDIEQKNNLINSIFK